MPAASAFATSEVSIPGMNNFDYSPDGRLLVGHAYTESGVSPDAKILNPETREVVATLPGRDGPLGDVAIWDVDWSPHGDLVATQAIDGTLMVWDPPDARVLSTIETVAPGAGWIEFSPDGTMLAASGGDGVARVWDVSSSRLVASVQVNDGFPMGAVTWSPDGRRLAVAPVDGRAVSVWDVRSDRKLWDGSSESGGFDVVWSPDGSTLVTSGFELDAWDAASGDHLFTEFPRVEIVDPEFSPNGELLAGGGSRGTARVGLLPERDAGAFGPAQRRREHLLRDVQAGWGSTRRGQRRLRRAGRTSSAGSGTCRRPAGGSA